MSGWIKVEKSLDDDPRVIRMCARLRNADVTQPYAQLLVIGALVKFWWYADTHIREDDTLDLGTTEIDQMVGLPGFCALLPECWLRKIDDNRVELPDFQEHNGVDAKRRAVTQKRVQRHRNAHSVTQALPDQTRPDQDQTKKKRAEAPVFDPGSIPGLDAAAWGMWLDHRKAIKHEILPHAMPVAAKKLAKLNGEQLAAVEHSIANGWQGLFAEKQINHPSARQVDPPRRAAKFGAS